MPITKIHLPCELFDDADITELANNICSAKAVILDSPIDRIRVFVLDLPVNRVSMGGKISADRESVAPFYEIYLLEGRSISQQQAVMAKIATLIEDGLNVQRSSIRGVCHMIPPSLWSIAGVPAANIRSAEIAKRAIDNN